MMNLCWVLSGSGDVVSVVDAVVCAVVHGHYKSPHMLRYERSSVVG
jgi:hypothetical protein